MNSERYINQELKDLEHTIFSAGGQGDGAGIPAVFRPAEEVTCAQVEAIQATARAVAQLDVLCSFAAVAVKNHYVMPQMTAPASSSIRRGAIRWWRRC